MSDDKLEKLHIDLPNHWAIGGESLWAMPLGNDLYRIENVPFFAYGLNYLDVVYAISDSPELKPEIQKVIQFSGNRTYRVIFSKQTEHDKQIELLKSLEQYGAYYERADKIRVSINIAPSGDHVAVYNQLDKYEASDYLVFETGEARVEGSFDDECTNNN